MRLPITLCQECDKIALSFFSSIPSVPGSPSGFKKFLVRNLTVTSNFFKIVTKIPKIPVEISQMRLPSHFPTRKFYQIAEFPPEKKKGCLADSPKVPLTTQPRG